ncbi:glycosyl hydrolase family 18 protein [Roseateles saccharophilus]|nr:glycosyl hydrolase family 18 protein [Roseateles saccharophilus]
MLLKFLVFAGQGARSLGRVVPGAAVANPKESNVAFRRQAHLLNPAKPRPKPESLLNRQWHAAQILAAMNWRLKKLAAWSALSMAVLGNLALADVKNFDGNACPAGYAAVTPVEATHNRLGYCSYLPPKALARLAGNASMSGSAGRCTVRRNDRRSTGTVMCKAASSPTGNGLDVVLGSTCPGNSVAATYSDAAADPAAVCAAMGRWDIARLVNQGQQASISGSGYGCKVAASDTRSLASSVCKPVQNTAYVEINDSDLANVGCFRKGNGDPVFQVAMIFAANIDADAAGNAVVHLNEQVGHLLNDDIQKVRALQAQGVKVVITLLNNHQDAGWSCFADDASADAFADTVKRFLDHYGLDGVDIDDEYDACVHHYPDSLVRVGTALRSALGSKIISKALWNDAAHFAPVHLGQKLGDQLSYGLEMTYDAPGSCMDRVQAYLAQGIERGKLGVGASTVYTSASNAATLNSCIADNKLGGGMMVFNVQNKSQDFVQAVWPGITVAPNCLH